MHSLGNLLALVCKVSFEDNIECLSDLQARGRQRKREGEGLLTAWRELKYFVLEIERNRSVLNTTVLQVLGAPACSFRCLVGVKQVPRHFLTHSELSWQPAYWRFKLSRMHSAQGLWQT